MTGTDGAISLRVCYAMTSTDGAISLRVCYAMASSEIAYGGSREGGGEGSEEREGEGRRKGSRRERRGRGAQRRYQVAFPLLLLSVVLRICYALSGVEIP
eukprot:2320663-Rhodomonas_salina.2